MALSRIQHYCAHIPLRAWLFVLLGCIGVGVAVRPLVLSHPPLHAPRPPWGRYQQPTQADVYALRSWMTCEQITARFSLPPTYLKDTYHIPPNRYPRITIEQAARAVGIAPDDLLRAIQNDLLKTLQTTH